MYFSILDIPYQVIGELENDEVKDGFLEQLVRNRVLI